MNKTLQLIDDLLASRMRAERILKIRRKRAMRSAAFADEQKRKHELQVTQIEAEMQSQALFELQQSRSEMQNSLERYADLYHHAPIGYLTLERDGLVRDINHEGAHIFNWLREDLVGLSIADLIAEKYQVTYESFIQRIFSDGGKQECEVMLEKVRGRSITIQITANANDSGKTCRAIVRDVTTRKEQEEKLRFASTVVNAVDEAIMVTGADDQIILVNTAFTTVTGYTAEEACGRTPDMLEVGSCNKDPRLSIWRSHANEDNWQGELECQRKNGQVYVEYLCVKTMRDEQGNILNRFAVFSDISERKAIEESLHHRAYYDNLTGLANRALLTDRLEHALIAAKRGGERVGVLFIDVDNLKSVNDKYGHEAGDALLVEVAQRLLECVRQSDTVSRFAGDEFVIILPDMKTPDFAKMVADSIQATIRKEMHLLGHVIQSSVSVGIAMSPDHGVDFEALLRCADHAMYCAKSKGGARSACSSV